MERLVRDACDVVLEDVTEWGVEPESGGGCATATEDDREQPQAPATCGKALQRRDSAVRDADVRSVHAVLVAGDHSWEAPASEGLGCRSLLDVAGRPVIAHALDWLRRQGVTSAAVCANGHTRLLRRQLGDGAAHGVALEYYQDVMPRGPAGCIHDGALDSDAETFLAISGATIPRMSIAGALQFHRQARAEATVISVSGRSGSLEPSGIYLFSRAALESIPPTGYQDVKETLLPALARRGKRVIHSRIAPDELLRVTDLESYLRVNRTMLESALDGLCGPEYARVDGACVHESAIVHPSVRLVGPVLIGPGCILGRNAVIVGPTSLASHVRLSPQAVVSRTTIWAGCHVGEGAIIDNSLLGADSVVGAKAQVRDALWTHHQRSVLGERTWRVTVPTAVRRLAS